MACDRSGCLCEAVSVQKNLRWFCSVWCSQSAEAHKPAVACQCGHDECREEQPGGR